MIELKDDGTVTIDFPEPTGPVTIRPPKYGAYRRLQNERHRQQGHVNEKIAALPELDAIPGRDDTSDEARKKRTDLAPIYQARVLEVGDYTAEALGNVWQLILLGSSGPDGDFAALASAEGGKTIPEDRDEWPIELLVDAADISVNADGDVVRTNPSILDTVLRHWGKGRFRFGPTELLSIP